MPHKPLLKRSIVYEGGRRRTHHKRHTRRHKKHTKPHKRRTRHVRGGAPAPQDGQTLENAAYEYQRATLQQRRNREEFERSLQGRRIGGRRNYRTRKH